MIVVFINVLSIRGILACRLFARFRGHDQSFGNIWVLRFDHHHPVRELYVFVLGSKIFPVSITLIYLCQFLLNLHLRMFLAQYFFCSFFGKFFYLRLIKQLFLGSETLITILKNIWVFLGLQPSVFRFDSVGFRIGRLKIVLVDFFGDIFFENRLYVFLWRNSAGFHVCDGLVHLQNKLLVGHSAQVFHDILIAICLFQLVFYSLKFLDQTRLDFWDIQAFKWGQFVLIISGWFGKLRAISKHILGTLNVGRCFF